MKIKVWLYNVAVCLNLKDGLFHPKEYILAQSYYSEHTTHSNPGKSVILMVDGRSIHGGLADRLKGAVTLYLLSKKLHRDYKIHWTFPFLLEDYLIPCHYDWRCSDSDIVYDSSLSAPVLLNDYQLPTSFHYFYLWRRHLAKRQLHVYSNSPYCINEFGKTFQHLFKPSGRLQTLIDKHSHALGSRYISCTFRFQQLLGDFAERDYPVLPQDKRQDLIIKCLHQLETIHIANPDSKIYVTSDSSTFLQHAVSFPYVYIVPGTVVHMDYTQDCDYKVYAKSFLDFYLISAATKSYLVCGDQMYRSGFARLASSINNHPYEEITF